MDVGTLQERPRFRISGGAKLSDWQKDHAGNLLLEGVGAKLLARSLPGTEWMGKGCLWNSPISAAFCNADSTIGKKQTPYASLSGIMMTRLNIAIMA